MGVRIRTFCLSTLFLILSLYAVSRCATDPGTNAPVGGGSVFRYGEGSLEVRVRRATGSRDTAFNVYSLGFSPNDNGTAVLSGSIESGTTLVFNAPTGATLTGCASSTPTYVGPILTAATYTVYQYTGSSCSSDATLSLSASAVTTNTGTGASRVLGATGSGGASNPASGFSGWTHQTAFYTSANYAANLGGLSGADSLCNVAGAAGSLTSSLPGTWKAILSSSTSSAASRITLSSTLPLKTTGGLTILSVADQLWSGSLLTSISGDENGDPLMTYVWSATESNGTASADTCADWTSAANFPAVAGYTSATDTNWIHKTGISPRCTASRPLYCINVPQ